jgi:hypothetical protein
VEISILNVYAPNTGAIFYIKKKKEEEKIQMALRAQIDTNTVIVGDLNPLYHQYR